MDDGGLAQWAKPAGGALPVRKRFGRRVMRSLERGEDWGWCYVNEVELDFAA